MNQILVLSKDTDFRHENIELLSRSGFTVADSSLFTDGLAKIEEGSFDIVIIDEELSDYDGFEACQKIRQDSNIPIILTGTGTYTEVQNKLEDASYNVYLSKPIDNAELLSAIQAIVVQPKPKKKRKRHAAKGRKSVNAKESSVDIPTDTGATGKENAEAQQKVSEYKPLTPDILTSPVARKDLKPEPLIPRPVKPDNFLRAKPVISAKQSSRQNINKIFCTVCGHENEKWHNFCNFCGWKLTTTNTPVHSGEESEKTQASVSDEKPTESTTAAVIAPEEKVGEQELVMEKIPEEREPASVDESIEEMIKQPEPVEDIKEEPVPVAESSIEQESTQQEPVMEEISGEREPAASEYTLKEEEFKQEEPVIEQIPEEKEPQPINESTAEIFKQPETVENIPEETVPVAESSVEQEITQQQPVMEETPEESEPAASEEISKEEEIKQEKPVMQEIPQEKEPVPVDESTKEIFKQPEPVEDMPEEPVPVAESSVEQEITQQQPVMKEIQGEKEPVPVNEYSTEQGYIQQEAVMAEIPEEREPAISEDISKEEEVKQEKPVMEELPENKEILPVDESTKELFEQPESVENLPEEIIPEYKQPTEEESSEKEPVMSYNLDENLPPAELPVEEVKPAPDESNIIKETPSLQISPSDTGNEQDINYQNGGPQIWEDGRAIKLVEAMVLGKITDIDPVIDLSSKDGYSYPQINSIIDGNDEDTNHTLQFLEKANILIKKPYEKLLMDPDGTFQLIPQERCPKCDSSNVISGQLVEHFACGYVGMEQDFRNDHKYVCPKCHRDMKLIGTDYRNAGIHYRCLNCNEIFSNPVMKWRSLNTRKVWNANDLKHVWVYSYSFSPDKKDWLEFQLKPKTQLIEFLKNRGYEVQESAQMSGSSGAVHIIDILAVRDDIMTKINLGIGILVAMPGENEVRLEELFKYDTRAYDIGINYKVVIAIPKLNDEAVKFAERQMIGTFEAKTLGSLVAHITSLSKNSENIITKGGKQVTFDDQQADTKSGPANILVGFLKKRGYEIFEKAKIVGKSGAEYVFDIIARREDGIVVPTIAIDMATLSPGEEVDINEISQFDSEAYDAGIRNKVFVGIPGIAHQAIQFAHQQRIKTIEAGDLEKYM